MSEVDFVRHSCSTDHMSCFAIMHYLIQFLCYTRTHLTCYNDLRILSDAFSRNLDNWPIQKSIFLWKQIHSKTLFLVKVICSPTRLKV